MNSQRLNNEFNLALDVSNDVREKTIDLGVGFDEITKTWEVIVKYHGDLSRLERNLNIQPTKLVNEYAIFTIPEAVIPRLLTYEEIEYIEKPKRVFFDVQEGKRASCILPLQIAPNNLFGAGVLVAIIDSGIDYRHPDFRNENGSTRILALWDQTIAGNPPKGYAIGTLYTREQINAALQQTDLAQQVAQLPSVDISGHGTHVAGIACGNGRASNGRYRGVASQSTILVVKLGSSVGNSFPRTTRVLEAVDFALRYALQEEMPLVINLSFGNNYGAHNGSALLEQYLNDAMGVGRTNIIVGTGNEGALGHHTSGVLRTGAVEEIELSVAEREATINLQIWKNYYDDFDILLTAPDGTTVGPLQKILGTQQFRIGNTMIYLYYGEPTPDNVAQEIYFEFVPNAQFIQAGIWRIQLLANQIVAGNYDLWLPTGEVIHPETRFLKAVEETTLTIPSTAQKVISVGAYDAYLDRFAYFSGRGFTSGNHQKKPDLVAPGVDILSTAPGGGYTRKTGTSMATPFVTGSVALMMEWGILKRNDPYLYGEKVKAYLRNGARKLPGFTVWPNQEVGWGALCLKDSLPD